MHRCAIEQHVAVRHTQEAGALLISLRAKPLDLEQLLAAGKTAVLFAVSQNIFGNGFAHARHARQQRRGRGIDVHADRTDAVLDHAVQRLTEPRLRHIMLVLSHPDGLGVDLDQFGQRVLEPPRDGDRGAQRHIKIRELLRAQLGRRIHRRARLGYDHVLHVSAVLPDKIRDENFRFPGCCAVADGDGCNPIGFAQPVEDLFGFRGLFVRRGRINDRGFEHFAGFVHHRKLAACAVGRVKSQRDAAFHGRLHQQRPQVQGKGMDRLLVCRIGQIIPNLALQRRENEAAVAVLAHGAQLIRIGALRMDERAAQKRLCFRAVACQGDL